MLHDSYIGSAEIGLTLPAPFVGTAGDDASESERIAMAMESIDDAIRILRAVDPVLLLNHASELSTALEVTDGKSACPL